MYKFFFNFRPGKYVLIDSAQIKKYIANFFASIHKKDLLYGKSYSAINLFMTYNKTLRAYDKNVLKSLNLMANF